MKRNRTTNIPTTATTPSDADSKDLPKRKKVYGGFDTRVLSADDKHDIVGCAIAMQRTESGVTSPKWSLGIVKFYLPKFDKYFVHMFSSEEGFTEFSTLPKALKEVNHWKLSENFSSVDFSRLCKDRFWIGGEELSKFHLLTDVAVWSRPEKVPDSSVPEAEWSQCTDCSYLIDTEEAKVACKYCSSLYHADCLLAFEKKQGPEYSPELLDKQAKRYRVALGKWRARKTSKNPSLVLEASDEEEDCEMDAVDDEFVCQKCRDCRFCCRPLFEEIIPSAPSLPSVEPWVVCRKCNAVAHGQCVFPSVPKLHASVEYECDECRECNSCGRVTYLEERKKGEFVVSPLTDWALPSFEQCKACWAGIDRGEYCPVCMKAWTTEWGGNMIQCDACAFWVHTECDSLDSELRSLSVSSVKYNCPICRDSTDIFRRRRVIDLLRTIDKIALFSEPVSAAFLPSYLKVIKQPMDLSRMKARNESAQGYVSNNDFIEDFELIVSNAKIFNMPNSPAYRLAEQFHKQGKLLVEKYLLVDKKGACKIEEGEERGKKKVPKYETVLEAINRRKKKKPTISTDIAPPVVSSGLISPYRRKLSGSLRSPMDQIMKIEASSVRSPIEQTLSLTAETGGQITEELIMDIFNFSNPFYLRNGNSVYANVNRNAFFGVPAKFEVILANTYTSKWTLEDRAALSADLSMHARFALYDCCTVCKAFGESWNFVDCVDCGEAVHWYCAGLFAEPDLAVVNPLGGGPVTYRCRACGPRQNQHSCAMCGGSQDVSFCLAGKENVLLCACCTLNQALKFLKAPSCSGCETFINPNLAALYLEAIATTKAEDPVPVSTFGRATPLVHCVVCGHTWHTRCVPEFADIATTDILGIYTCASCQGSTQRVDVTEILTDLGNHLRNFKAGAYREIQLDLVAETLRGFGLGLASHEHVHEVLEMFSVAGTCLADCAVARPADGQLSTQEAEWIEWGLIHKEFLIGLGHPEMKKKVDLGILPSGGVSVKIKRTEDEDLLLAKRLYVLFRLVGIDTKAEPFVGTSKPHLGPWTDTADTCKAILGESEAGTTVLAHWLRESQLYTGPGTARMHKAAVPAWESRRCSLCLERGDHLVLGVLLPYGASTFVHSECLGWSLPRVQAVDFTHVIESAYLMPKIHSAGPRMSESLMSLSDSGAPQVMLPESEPNTPPQSPKTDARLVYTETELIELVKVSKDRKCTLCHKNGASVSCQQCQSTWFHLGCAFRGNDATRGLLMDSRCRLLTCADCLNSSLRNFFVNQFTSDRLAIKANQSVVQQIFAQRHLNPISVDSDSSETLNPTSELIVREGTLAIIDPGTCAEYDGSGSVKSISNFVSTRLFWTVDWTLRSADNEFMQSVIGRSAANNKSDLHLLKKKRKTVYVNKIFDGKYTIEILGGRIVAIGKSIAEVWAEFQTMVGVSALSGEWFFGLESEFMKAHANAFALQCVRKNAQSSREKWIYNPELRARLTSVLQINNDLKPVRSWRRDLKRGEIDQLKNLGRIPVLGDVKSEFLESLLDPASVIAISTTDKVGRAKSTTASSDSSKYKARSLVGDMEVLSVKRSHIHNYGLFAKIGFAKGDMVVEYQGEVLRQTIADEREKRAERQGNGDGGSCYMFKLDDDYVVDATVKGNCARFINHSCNPNCTCKMVEDEQHRKHIMIIAKRDIVVGEEITYDYQFAVESEKLACLCGAPNCLGRLN